MAKKVTGFLKLQVPAGAANPSPPIGPALGQRGLNIMEFCKAFNAQKMKDLNCDTIEAAMKMIEGSARSMGLTVAE